MVLGLVDSLGEVITVSNGTETYRSQLMINK